LPHHCLRSNRKKAPCKGGSGIFLNGVPRGLNQRGKRSLFEWTGGDHGELQKNRGRKAFGSRGVSDDGAERREGEVGQRTKPPS